MHRLSEHKTTPWFRVWISLGAAVSLGLYLLLPRVAAGLALAEPSLAGEVFPGVPLVTRQALTAAQEAGAYPATPARFLGLCAGLFAIYGAMLWLVRDRRSAKVQAFLFGAGAVFLAVHLLTPIMLSTDVFAYAIYGRVLSVYGANPYSAAPPISATDPFMPLFGQPYLPSWYGPLWTLTSAGLAWLGGERVGLTVLLFRGFAVIAALGTAGLLWNNLRRFAPEKASQGLVLFLWNPLLVMETGLSGHNDPVMLALVMFGVWLHLRGWKTGAVVAFTLSALVKFLTGMLVPLYIWMVLRQAATWRERWVFLGRSALGAGVVCLAALLASRSGSDVPASHAATSPDFYAHNYHELIFKGLRRAFGEDAESVRASIYFQGWWIVAKTNSALRASAAPDAEVRRQIQKGERLLVILPQEMEWARVYDPVTRQKGCVDTTSFEESTRPALADADPLARQLESVATEWPTVRLANGWVRAVTWLLFAGFGLLAAWRTTNFEQFLVWSAAALLASYYLIVTEIWPWYINWALAVGALQPARLPAKLAVLLSACVLSLYVTIGFQGGEPAWIYPLRSLPAFLLPMSVFVVIWFRQMISKRSHATAC